MEPTERWLPVVGFEDLYEVSDHGQVRSLPRRARNRYSSWIRPSQIIRPYSLRQGHRVVNLVPHEGVKHIRKACVHVLVLEAFVGPRPEGYDGCHNDGDPTNNHLSNLRWDTRSANSYDCVKHGNHPLAKRDRCKRDHPLDGVVYWPDGSFKQRFCRTCHNAVVRRNYHAKRVEKTA